MAGTPQEIISCIKAIENKDIAALKQAIAEVKQRDININTCYQGKNLLLWSITANDPKMFALLYKEGSSQTVITEQGETMLHLMLQLKAYQLINSIWIKSSKPVPLKFYHDVMSADLFSKRDEKGNTFLMLAAETVDFKTFKQFYKRRRGTLQMYVTEISKTKSYCTAKMAEKMIYDEEFMENNKNGESILFFAIKSGSIDILNMLIKKHPDFLKKLHDRDNQGNTLSHIAAQYGHIDLLKWLLKNKALNNEPNINGETPILLAASKGYFTIVQWLEGNNGSLIIKNNRGISTLMYAGANLPQSFDSNRILELMCWLTNKGLQPNDKDIEGNNALIYAIKSNNIESANTLLHLGVYLHTRNLNNESSLRIAEKLGFTNLINSLNKTYEAFIPFHQMVSKNDMVAINQLLARNRLLINTLVENESPLMIAAKADNINLIEFLVAQGARINLKNSDGNCAAHVAAQHGHINALTSLIKLGASCQEKNFEGNSLILTAAINGHISVIEQLLKFGANLNEINNYSNNALHLAAAHGQTATVLWLLKQGMNLNLQGNYGNTPFLWAVYHGKFEVAKALLECGASIAERNNNNSSAILLAAESGHVDMMKWLIEKGASLEDKNNKGDTPLIVAAYYGRKLIVEFLLSKNVFVLDTNNSGDDALFNAKQAGHIEIANIIKAAIDKYNLGLATIVTKQVLKKLNAKKIARDEKDANLLEGFLNTALSNSSLIKTLSLDEISSQIKIRQNLVDFIKNKMISFLVKGTIFKSKEDEIYIKKEIKNILTLYLAEQERARAIEEERKQQQLQILQLQEQIKSQQAQIQTQQVQINAQQNQRIYQSPISQPKHSHHDNGVKLAGKVIDAYTETVSAFSNFNF